MKKILPYLFAFSLLASANAAIEPEVFIGGKFNFSSAMTSQSSDYTQKTLPHGSDNENKLNKDQYFSQDAYIDVLVLGKTDNAALYGARAALQLDSQRQHASEYDSSRALTVSDSSEPVLTRRAYMFLEKKTMGRVEMGDVESASKKMKFDASYRFGGTGGISGNWWRYVNIPDFGLRYDSSTDDGNDDCSNTAVYNANDVRYCGSGGKGNMGFIIRPDLPLAHGYNKAQGADKFDDTRTVGRITYFSPRISGLQFGVSYAPDSGDRGGSYYGDGFTNSTSGDVADVIDWGINYVEQFNDVGIGISLTGEYGYAEDTLEEDKDEFVQQDLQAYALGTYIFFGNASVSASYGTWDNSLMMVRTGLNSSDSDYREDSAHYTTLGVGYQFGPYKLGISNMTSEYREQQFILTSAAFDYRLSKNFALYAEWNSYEFDAKDEDLDTLVAGETRNNSGEVILVGAKLHFGEFDSVSQIVLDTSLDSY